MTPLWQTLTRHDTHTLPTLLHLQNWEVQSQSTERKGWEMIQIQLAGNVVKMGTYNLIVEQKMFIVQNAKVLVLMSQALAGTVMIGTDHSVVVETTLEVEIAVEILHEDVTDKEVTAEVGKTVVDELPDGQTDMTAEDGLTVELTNIELVQSNTRRPLDMKLLTELRQKVWMLIMLTYLQTKWKMKMNSLREISMKIVIR